MEFESTAGRHLTADVSPGTARRLYEGGTSIYLREVAQLAPLGAALANDLVMPGRRRPVHLHVVATPWLDVVLDTPRGRLIREPSLRVGADDLRDPARRDAMLAAASRPPHDGPATPAALAAATPGLDVARAIELTQLLTGSGYLRLASASTAAADRAA